MTSTGEQHDEDGRPAAPPVTAALLGPTGLTGLVRLTITTAWRALAWTAGTTLNTGNEVLTRALRGDPPVLILYGINEELRSALVALLGGQGGQGSTGGTPPRDTGTGRDAAAASNDLRARGAALLDQSADVDATSDDTGHPAYARILSEITPDEARILRLLYQAGPQPAIDVRTGRPLGIGSELVVGGLNMIAEHAGLRRMDRIHPYLTNLNRQGLIDFSKEQVADPDRYQLIEAQPHVTEARARAGFAPKIVYRSIMLTTFGRDFCHACLPTNGAAPSNGAPPAEQSP
jgi:hypothetical protein